MKFGSPFSGFGGLALGLQRAGMKCAWHVEKDQYCRRVLAKNWPDVERFIDVKDVGKHNLKPVDLIAGGFPCQPHSYAGKRKGADDDRNLWPEYFRIITELQPTWVIGENVLGIVTTILDQVLSDLESVGYEARPIIVPVCAFDAPHVRDRVFILAYSESARRNTWSDKSNTKYDEKGSARKSEFARSDTRNAKVSANASIQGLQERQAQKDTSLRSAQRTNMVIRGEAREWPVEPGVGRVANGIPHRVERLKGLGNAVVPQVAEWLGKLIMEVNYEHTL